MKRIFVVFTFTMVAFIVSAQTTNSSTNKASLSNDEVFCYKLYPTSNMWNFLKLDTRNGRIWQVQWSTEDDKRFETVLSSIFIVPKDEERDGRFALYPTTNIYNFIMLDQVNGKAYQVQWSFDANNRGIVPIE